MNHMERRMGRRLYAKWHNARRSPGLPSLADFEAEVGTDFDADLRERSFVIDATPGPSGYRFSRFGTALRQIAGVDFTGYRVASLPSSIADDALSVCHSAIAAGRPVSRDEEMIGLFGQQICYRLMVLPTAGRSQHVDALVGTVGFRLRNTLGADLNYAEGHAP
jgi:hypothetical protein